jgi:hypothetical protein
MREMAVRMSLVVLLLYPLASQAGQPLILWTPSSVQRLLAPGFTIHEEAVFVSSVDLYSVTGHTVFPRRCQPIFRPLSRIPFLGDWSAVLREHASGIGYWPV